MYSSTDDRLPVTNVTCNLIQRMIMKNDEEIQDSALGHYLKLIKGGSFSGIPFGEAGVQMTQVKWMDA